ncbi:hypothetical protein [Chromobacterium subtsugae]|uniref:hypothetical protein n=1 Tax=Chromobacterium subtsugae TaxID=251747 RepID=UPI000640E4F7|nr:hypothetical protein [Chromobacterium subtsugae]
MQPLTQLADAARVVIAAFDRAGELTDELISALELALNGAELSPATEQSGEAVAWRVVSDGKVHKLSWKREEATVYARGLKRRYPDKVSNPRAEPLYTRPQPALQSAQQLPSVIEEIALQWDGCEYESSTGQIDIGWAIRAAGQRLLAAPQPREGDCHADA